ncbi:hypothetical protein F4810DRAFT_708466 [Camillea tinctor]|nr:hypothetical protein F4810DRAFT_708466 [Camillea tinctor]
MAISDGGIAAIDYDAIKDLKYGQKAFFGVDDTKVGQERKDFWEKMNTLYKELGGKNSGGKDRFVGIYDQAKTWYTGLSVDEKKQVVNRAVWAIDQVQKAWENLSFMPRPVTDPTEVEYIRVRSRSAVDSVVEVMFGPTFKDEWSSDRRPTTLFLAEKLADATGPDEANLYANVESSCLKVQSLLGGSQPAGASGQGRSSLGGEGGEGGEGIGGSPPSNPGNPGNPGSNANDEYWLGTVDIPPVKRIPHDTLRAFVGGFRSGKFGVVSEPEPTTKVGFLEKDQWNCWFDDVLGTNSPMQMAVDAAAQPSGFFFSMTPPDLGFSLDFSTEAVYKAFDMVKANAPEIGLSTRSTMIFGLEPPSGEDGSKTIKSTLLQMMKYIKLEHMSESPLVQLLKPELELTLSVKDGSRNAVWFQPASANRTTQRLQWDFDATSLNASLKEANVNIELQDAFIATTRTTVLRPGPQMLPSGELRLHTTVASQGNDLDLMCSIGLRDDGFSMAINASKSSFNAFITWLKTVLGEELSLSLDGIEFIAETITPRRLSLNIQQKAGKISVRDWSVYIEASINSVPILLSYNNDNKLLQGQVWVVSEKTEDKLLPSWEQSDQLLPSDGDPTKTLKLSDLLGMGQDIIPKVIPNTIKTAKISIDLSTKTIGFATTLTCEPAESEGGIPPFSIDTVDMRVSYSATTQLKASFSIQASVHMPDPDEEDEDDPAKIRGKIEYNGYDQSWELSASIDAVSFNSLYNLLDPNAQEDVAAILGHFELGKLKLEYEYGKTGKGKNFTLFGVLYIGPVGLSMEYIYNDQGWSLEAKLGAADAEDDLTLGDIVDDLTDNYGDDAEDLPDFIRGLTISGADDYLIRIRCVKVSNTTGQVATATDNPREAYLLFQATVSLGMIDINFFHYRDLSIGAKGDPPKRVFKISMSPLPEINMKDTVGTLGSMPQPFDEIAYVWVQDKKNQIQNPNKAGLTEQDVDRINGGLPNPEGPNQPNEVFILYRDTRKPGNKSPNDMVVPTGSHFMVIVRSANTKRAIIDYTLGRKNKGQGTVGALATKEQGQTGNSAMAECKKVAGGVSISNIGLRYKDGVLYVLLDASFLLGPIGFTFIEAAVGITLTSLRNISTDDIKFGLSGLAIAFDQPPVRLGGILMYKDTSQMKYFAGGLVVGLEPYQLTASGMYGQMKNPDFDTAFVFAKLEGPLITLEFAEISGITGGFGYNNEVKPPPIERVNEFPFIKTTQVGDDLVEYLRTLVSTTGFFTVKDGAMWLAAGLKVNAFKMLDIDAVFIVSWSPTLTLGIYGVAVAQIPKSSGRPFAHVELGLLASVDFGAGVFKVEMQLAPSSYIFDPSCRLTGGFALYYWFNDSVRDHSGDWVFTIGGYHRAFKRPAYYPNPPRLGIYWQVGDTISIVGEAYFAITPKACMGGGRLEATLVAGPLRAWFAAWADFLINYNPFDFVGQVSVSIGVSCKVDLLITSFTVKIEIGAQLDLMGPPLRGRVKVDLWIVSFKIYFGPEVNDQDPPSLQEFYQMVLEAGQTQSMVESLLAMTAPKSRATASAAPHVFTCRGGMVTDSTETQELTTGEDAVWRVEGKGFAVAVDVLFALTHATVKAPTEHSTTPVVDDWESGEQPDLHAKPMEKENQTLSSVLTVDIFPVIEALAYMEENVSEENWQVTEIIKQVPAAMWGKYNPNENPRKTKKNDIKSLLDPDEATVPKLMGLVIRPPKPKLADDLIGKFDAVLAMQLGVFTQEEIEQYSFKGFDPGDGDLLPSRQEHTPQQIQDAWAGNAGQPRQEILDCLAKGLGWKEGIKTAATPKRTVEDLEVFYPFLPDISVN